MPKDPIEQNKKCGVVYEVPCRDCSKVYVGQTGNSLETRLKQHRAACRLLQVDKSALAQHAIDDDHTINWSEAKVIASETRWRQRLFAEAFHTTKRQDRALNRCELFLPNVYKRLLTWFYLTWECVRVDDAKICRDFSFTFSIQFWIRGTLFLFLNLKFRIPPSQWLTIAFDSSCAFLRNTYKGQLFHEKPVIIWLNNEPIQSVLYYLIK